MPFQPVADTVQANMRFLMAGTPAENTAYFKKTGGYSQADLDALAEAIGEWVVDESMAFRNSAVVYTETYVKGLESAIDLQSSNTVGSGAVGTEGLSQANNVTKAFTIRSGFTGRSARGRLFWIGMSGDHLVSTDQISAGFVDEITGILDALKVIVEALGWIWVIVSRFTAGAPRVAGVTTPVTSFGVSNFTVDSMRGRLD